MMSHLIVGGTAEERLKTAKLKFPASNFDTIIITGGNSIGIEQIRNLNHHLNLKPYNSAYKVAIIHPGELLTIESQNALLKILEEPNETSMIILTAPQPETLLPTVVSRCQIIKLPSKSEITLTDEEIAQLFNGLIVLFSSGAGERLKFASTVGKSKEEIKEWLVRIIFVCREILFLKCHPEHFDCHSERSEKSRDSSAFSLRMTSLQIVKIIRNLEKTRNMLDQNINPRLALEVFLLDLPKVSIQSTPGVE